MADLPDDDDDDGDIPAQLPKRRGRLTKVQVRKLTEREQQTKSALYHLTPLELRFVKARLVTANNAEAIKQAGFKGTDKKAKHRAWRIMQRPVVRAAMYELMVQAFDKSSIEVTQWLRETASIAFMPAEMIEGKPKWSDKMQALTRIGEFQKLLERNSSGTRETNVINMIVQAAKPKEPSP